MQMKLTVLLLSPDLKTMRLLKFQTFRSTQYQPIQEDPGKVMPPKCTLLWDRGQMDQKLSRCNLNQENPDSKTISNFCKERWSTESIKIISTLLTGLVLDQPLGAASVQLPIGTTKASVTPTSWETKLRTYTSTPLELTVATIPKKSFTQTLKSSLAWKGPRTRTWYLARRQNSGAIKSLNTRRLARACQASQNKLTSMAVKSDLVPMSDAEDSITILGSPENAWQV